MPCRQFSRKIAVTILLCALVFAISGELEYVSKNSHYAFLVAGSKGYVNYRHQADVYHAYHVLKEKGVPEKNIILMAYDDIAHNEMNPDMGRVYNRPGGSDVYQGVIIDYAADALSAANFFAVLAGNRSSDLEKPRLTPTPNESVFIYIVSHGGKGFFSINHDVVRGVIQPQVYSDDFKTHLNLLASECDRVLVFLESCYSGSLFTLSDIPLRSNILAITASNDSSDSFACYWDDSAQAYLGDQFSTSWIESTEKLQIDKETLHDLFTIAKIETQDSSVSVFGNSSFLFRHLPAFFGNEPTRSVLRGSPSREIPNRATLTPSLGVQLDYYGRQLRRKEEHNKRQKLNQLTEIKQKLELIFRQIDRNLPTLSPFWIADSPNRSRLLSVRCYKQLNAHFRMHCVDPVAVQVALSHTPRMLELCQTHPTQADQIKKLISASCSLQGFPLKDDAKFLN